MKYCLGIGILSSSGCRIHDVGEKLAVPHYSLGNRKNTDKIRSIRALLQIHGGAMSWGCTEKGSQSRVISFPIVELWGEVGYL